MNSFHIFFLTMISSLSSIISEVFDIDICSSNPCVYGTCQPSFDTYRCTCLLGAHGRNCELMANQCILNPCIQGNCTSHLNYFTCTCPHGYTGSHCEIVLTSIDDITPTTKDVWFKVPTTQTTGTIAPVAQTTSATPETTSTIAQTNHIIISMITPTARTTRTLVPITRTISALVPTARTTKIITPTARTSPLPPTTRPTGTITQNKYTISTMEPTTQTISTMAPTSQTIKITKAITSIFTATSPSSATAAYSIATLKTAATPVAVYFTTGDISLCSQRSLHGAETLTQYGYHCYEIMNISSRWNVADMHCKNRGGQLLSVSSASEEEYIFRLLNYYHKVSPFWTGLHDSIQEEHFEWSSEKREEAQAYINLLKWAQQRPSLNHDQEDCVVVNPTRHPVEWDDVMCNETNQYICQYEIAKPLPTQNLGQLPTEVSHHPCDSVLHDSYGDRYAYQYYDKCYEVMPNTFVDRDFARDICRFYGGKLATIKNDNEQKYVAKVINEHYIAGAFWIDLIIPSSRVLGSSFGTYTHFGAEVFNAQWHSSTTKQCVVILVNGYWSNESCSSKQAIICEYRVSQPVVMVGK